jgi:DNA-binding NtrC family response regulator
MQIREQRHIHDLRGTISGMQACKNLRTENGSLVGASPAIQHVRELIRQVAEANVDTILITGETGTGKEVVAHQIHSKASSAQNPFIAVNCPALPESLVESELFGHVKGAFTGATMDRAGYFEQADNGTLFLDEIADLSLSTQAKLLRALETRMLRRVGGTKEISIQERVIGAINAEPEYLVASGKFRCDLFHRLNLFPIHLTPLRERPEDILPLAQHFLTMYADGNGHTFDDFSKAAKDLLLDFHYPGNARELRNVIVRAAILCGADGGQIGIEHIRIQTGGPQSMSSQSGKAEALVEGNKQLTLQEALAGDERRYLRHALAQTYDDKGKAARLLGIPRRTLYRKLAKYGL